MHITVGCKKWCISLFVYTCSRDFQSISRVAHRWPSLRCSDFSSGSQPWQGPKERENPIRGRDSQRRAASNSSHNWTNDRGWPLYRCQLTTLTCRIGYPKQKQVVDVFVHELPIKIYIHIYLLQHVGVSFHGGSSKTMGNTTNMF